MAILDKLLEKKDIFAYAKFRKEELANDMKREMKTAPEKKRELIKERFIGRIAELDEFCHQIKQNTLKVASINYCTSMYERKKGEK